MKKYFINSKEVEKVIFEESLSYDVYLECKNKMIEDYENYLANIVESLEMLNCSVSLNYHLYEIKK